VRTAVDALAEASERVDRLQAALQAEATGPVRLVETHLSWVLLTDELAYKIKKPVRLPFVDLTAISTRARLVREELRINRRWAPWLYLDVVEVVDGLQGPCIGGPGTVVDVALRMRRFPDGALWSERVGRGALTAEDVAAFADMMADHHRAAAIAPCEATYGTPVARQRLVRQLVESLDSAVAKSGVRELRAWLPNECLRLAEYFEGRRLAGRVRECHGDLHLANIVHVGGRGQPFDAIEFEDSLRWIDVGEDIAFPVMDLMGNGHARLGWHLLNAWLERSGDYDVLPALRFHLICRALVRALVMAVCERTGTVAEGPTSGDYRALAVALLERRALSLGITHGLPGSGKTQAARVLSEVAGAVLVRSDVERKRLFVVAPLASLQAHSDAYSTAATGRTYARLAEVARMALGSGWPVFVDAAFLRRSERDAFASLAADAGVSFGIVDCRAPMDVLRQRVERRQTEARDASEANLVVLERLAEFEGPLDVAEQAHALAVQPDSHECTLIKDWKRLVRPLE